MVVDIVEDVEYKEMVESQVYELIDYMITKDHEFSLTANIKAARFNPEMPATISKNFPPFTMFSLMNYTFTTIELTNTHISFEAGFGAENFGSTVTLPLYSIFQVLVDESILFLNPTATVEKYFEEKNHSLNDGETQEQRSRNAFTMNKKNKNLV